MENNTLNINDNFSKISSYVGITFKKLQKKKKKSINRILMPKSEFGSLNGIPVPSVFSNDNKNGVYFSSYY